MGGGVSHADINIRLRPSKRRAEDTEVESSHKEKRSRIGDEEDTGPKAAKDEENEQSVKEFNKITDVFIRVK